MKVLTIIGSGRKKGNTSKVSSLLMKKIETLAKSEGEIIDVEELFLSDYDIRHCIGCRICMNRGEEKCPLDDDLPKIKSKVDKADAVIFASPVYVGDVSSMMKALIDRLAYICHRQEFYTKNAFVYSTSSGSGNGHTNRSIAGALISWGFNLLGTEGFKTDCFDTKEEIEQKYRRKLDRIAEKIFYGLKNQIYMKPSVLSLAMFKLQQRERANPEIAHPLDYQYWKDRDWADSSVNYYFKHKTGQVKMFLSKILYKTISLIFVH